MGIENNECIIATTCDETYINKVNEWINTLDKEDQTLFAFVPSLVNKKTTVVMGPDGSKKGWETFKHGEDLREQFVMLLKSFDYSDGSNPFDWVEVGYGEYGQKVLRGNCENMHGEGDYCGE